jgi:nitroreductase
MLVHENHYQPVDDAVLAEYDEQMAQYYLARQQYAPRYLERPYPSHYH